MRRLRLCLTIGLVAAMLFSAAPVSAAPPDGRQAQASVVHVVQPGENLFRISLRYGTTVDAIVAANGLTNRRVIRVGQRLVIPRGANDPAMPGHPATTGGTYVVQRGDTLSAIALRYGVSAWAIVQANDLSNANVIYAGQRLVIPGSGTGGVSAAPATGSTYVVRRGDTLSLLSPFLLSFECAGNPFCTG